VQTSKLYVQAHFNGRLHSDQRRARVRTLPSLGLHPVTADAVGSRSDTEARTQSIGSVGIHPSFAFCCHSRHEYYVFYDR